MSFPSLFLHSPDSRRGGFSPAAGLAAACLALFLGACAQPTENRMGGPGEGMAPDNAMSERAMRQLPPTPPGDINRSDTNLERPEEPTQSGPPSVVKPVQ